jgi:hypothetical protein
MANRSRAGPFNTLRGCNLHAQNDDAQHHTDQTETGKRLFLGKT